MHGHFMRYLEFWLCLVGNPSLLNLCDVISDVIGDIISTPKCYISRSIEFYDIQQG